MIAGSTAKLGNSIAIKGTTVNKHLVPAERERREILHARIDHLTRDIPQAESHLTVKLLTSLGVQQGSCTADLFIALDIVIRSLPKPVRQQKISVVSEQHGERDNIGRPESPQLVDAGHHSLGAARVPDSNNKSGMRVALDSSCRRLD